MCLAVPAQIISLDDTLAVAEMSGVKKQIDVTLTPEAQETLAAMRTAGILGSDAMAAS